MTGQDGGVPRVLCAGDRFITADALAGAVRAAFADGVETVPYGTEWPDVPFGTVGGVREASGDPEELARLAAGCTAVVTHLAPLTADVIAAMPGLRVIGSTRGGPVNVDLDAATRAGVPVLYLPGRNLSAVAEFTVGVMIALMRGVHPAATGLGGGQWDARYFRFEETGPELGACTVGLFGLGAIGRRVAELLGAFGATVLAHDPFADEDEAAAAGVKLVPFDELLAGSDVISLHARLTDDTRRRFDARAFAAMRPGSYFVNTARGQLVDTDALRDALLGGHLAGAALDVFDPEPPAPDDLLLGHPRLLPTPHLAGGSRQVALRSAQRVAEAVEAFWRTGALGPCANPDWTAHRRL